MTKKFNELFEDFTGYYSGLATNDLTLKTAEKIGSLLPEVGDIIQVQIAGNLDPDVADKENAFNTYKVTEVKGSKLTLVFAEMIHGDEVETFANPSADLDGTYMNSVAELKKVPSELTIDLAKLGANTLNYCHDNIWTMCIVNPTKE